MKIRFGDKQTSNDILYGARHNCLAYPYSMVEHYTGGCQVWSMSSLYRFPPVSLMSYNDQHSLQRGGLLCILLSGLVSGLLVSIALGH